MDATTPYKFIGFGAMDATTPYKFIDFADPGPHDRLGCTLGDALFGHAKGTPGLNLGAYFESVVLPPPRPNSG